MIQAFYHYSVLEVIVEIPELASCFRETELYSGCNGLHLGTAANFAVFASSTETNADEKVSQS